jgi:hypothetical protein
MVVSYQKKILFVLTVLVAAGLAIGGSLYLATGNLRKGQPELVHLDARNLETLRGEFNAGVGGTRALVLLSPT